MHVRALPTLLVLVAVGLEGLGSPAAARQASNDLDAFMEPDLRFHTLLLEACGNELLEHMSEIFTAVLRTVFAYSSSSSRAYPRAARRHQAIVKAIEARDPDAAEQAVVRLIDDTKANVASALRRGPRR